MRHTSALCRQVRTGGRQHTSSSGVISSLTVLVPVRTSIDTTVASAALEPALGSASRIAIESERANGIAAPIALIRSVVILCRRREASAPESVRSWVAQAQRECLALRERGARRRITSLEKAADTCTHPLSSNPRQARFKYPPNPSPPFFLVIHISSSVAPSLKSLLLPPILLPDNVDVARTLAEAAAGGRPRVSRRSEPGMILRAGGAFDVLTIASPDVAGAAVVGASAGAGG